MKTYLTRRSRSSGSSRTLSQTKSWLSAMGWLLILMLSRSSGLCQTLINSGSGWTQYSTSTGWVLYDTVETGNWSVLGGSFSTGQDGLTPTNGSSFFNGSNTGTTAQNRGIDRLYSGVTLQAGTYTVTFDMGDFTSTAFASGSREIKLMGDTSDNGYSYSDRISTGIQEVSTTTPVDGWTTWTYSFTVTSSTLNVGGY